MSDSDAFAAELLASIASGDQSAMEKFYKLYESRLFRFLRSRLNDSFAAADILNEVMLEVWRSAGRFEGRSMVTSWLFGIAQHRMVDYQRRNIRHDKNRHYFAEDEAEFDMQDESLPDSDRIVAGMQSMDQLQQCMDALSDSHRQVISMAFLEEMSYPQIAEIVDAPVGTIKTRVFHARKLLQECLSAAGVQA